MDAEPRNFAGFVDARTAARKNTGALAKGAGARQYLLGGVRAISVAIPELEERRAAARLGRFCERVPAHLRDKLSYHWSVRGNQITLVERRPVWRGEPGEFTDSPIARFQFEPGTHRWTLKWRDRNGRFHFYEELESVRSFERVVDEVESDPTGIFLG